MASRATIHDEQYRPICTGETAANDALSVRDARDIAMGINNAVARACAPRLVDCWPSSTLTAQFYASHNDTDEHVLMPPWPPVFCGPGGHYTHAAWGVVAWIYTSSNDCTLRLYSSEQRYRGPATVTAAARDLLGAYQYDELTADKTPDADGVDVLSSGDGGLLLAPSADGMTHFMLTCTFADASANNGIVILQKTITLGRVLLDWAT